MRNFAKSGKLSICANCAFSAVPYDNPTGSIPALRAASSNARVCSASGKSGRRLRSRISGARWNRFGAAAMRRASSAQYARIDLAQDTLATPTAKLEFDGGEFAAVLPTAISARFQCAPAARPAAVERSGGVRRAMVARAIRCHRDSSCARGVTTGPWHEQADAAVDHGHHLLADFLESIRAVEQHRNVVAGSRKTSQASRGTRTSANSSHRHGTAAGRCRVRWATTCGRCTGTRHSVRETGGFLPLRVCAAIRNPARWPSASATRK